MIRSMTALLAGAMLTACGTSATTVPAEGNVTQAERVDLRHRRLVAGEGGHHFARRVRAEVAAEQGAADHLGRQLAHLR